MNLGDEGFLWYGARATARGKVPIRDFQSYDPGRYDWCAAFMRARGDEGILTLRLACHAFELAGLGAALAVVARGPRNPAVRATWGIVALTWMFPLFRTFETALASCAVLALTRLLERPTAMRHFQAGLSIGIAAYFGRNHGVYHLAAYLLAGSGLPPATPRDKAAALCAAGAGIVVGYLPVLVKCATVPGFAAALRESVEHITRGGRTNIALAPPWPLRRCARPTTLFDLVNGGLFAALPLAYGAVLAARALRGRRFARENPALFAAACAGVPYLHYAFSRADHYHLASSIHPFLFALAVAPGAARDRRLRGVLGASSLIVSAAFTAVMATRMTPLLIRRCAATPYRDVRAATDTLVVDERSARLIEAALELNELVGQAPCAVYVATAPALYAVLDRESPIYDIYWSLASGDQYEDAMIAAFEASRVAWVLFEDVPLDALDVRRVHNSHARFWRHVLENFHRVPQPSFPPDVLVLRRDAEDDPPLSPVLSFDERGIREQLATGIFRDADASGAWASGRVRLKLGVPAGATALHVELFVPEFPSPTGRPQRLRCRFTGGSSAEDGPLPPGLHAVAFELPPAVRSARSVLVSLEPDWTLVPRDAGIGPDRRELSVRLLRAAERLQTDPSGRG